MPADPHPWLLGVPAATHGGSAPSGMLDLSASIAPLGPSAAAVAAAARACIAAYPNATAEPLVHAAAAELGVDAARVAPGAGAADLLLRAVLAHVSPGEAVMIVTPCFGEYRRVVGAAGATVVEHRLQGPGFGLDAAALARQAQRAGAVAGLVATPANPTGVAAGADAIRELVQAAPATRWIVDEAFVGLADDRRSAAGGDAVVVRSLTKELALPGLRVGVADAPPASAEAMRALAPPWCVSAPALTAATAGLADTAHRAATREAVARGRAGLEAVLDAAAVERTPAAANWVCFRPPAGTASCRAALWAEGIVVRDCEDLGLAGWLRMAVPPPAELERVAAVLGGSLR